MRAGFVLALLSLVLVAAGAAAQVPPAGPDLDELRARSREVMADGVVGSAVVHAVYAETAQALIDVLELRQGLPAEATADELATWLMLPPDRQDRRFVLLAEIVQVWQLMERRAAATGAAMPFWTARGYGRPQFDAAMCIVWGRGPVAYRTLAQRAGLAMRDQERCVAAERAADARWRGLLGERLAADATMGPGRMAMVVDWQVLAMGSAIRALRESAMLEALADQITAAFVLPAEIVLRVDSCTDPAVAWRPGDGAIVLCEGLIDAFDRLVRPAFRERG